MSEDKHRQVVWFSTEFWYGFQPVYTAHPDWIGIRGLVEGA